MGEDIGYFEQVRRKAHAYNQTLSADDPRFKRCVRITHHDGEEILNNAFLLEYEDPEGRPTCIIVVSEHFGARVYPKSDLHGWIQYEKRLWPEDAPFSL